MNCEYCNLEHEITDSHSMLIVLQKADTISSSLFQCDKGTEHNTLTFQHWNCCHSHMITSVLYCLSNHFNESDLKTYEGVNFHKFIMKAGLNCKVCGVPLDTTAYRFCLTNATPVNYVPDLSTTEKGEWCCSLNHAQQSALDIVRQLVEVKLEGIPN